MPSSANSQESASDGQVVALIVGLDQRLEDREPQRGGVGRQRGDVRIENFQLTGDADVEGAPGTGVACIAAAAARSMVRQRRRARRRRRPRGDLHRSRRVGATVGPRRETAALSGHPLSAEHRPVTHLESGRRAQLSIPDVMARVAAPPSVGVRQGERERHGGRPQVGRSRNSSTPCACATLPGPKMTPGMPRRVYQGRSDAPCIAVAAGPAINPPRTGEQDGGQGMSRSRSRPEGWSTRAGPR